MEHLISKLQAENQEQSADDQLAEITGILRATPLKTLADTTTLGKPLDILDPSVNSIPYLLIIRAHLKLVSHLEGQSTSPAAILSKRELWEKVKIFLRQYDRRQVIFVLEDWRQLLEEIIGGTFSHVTTANTVICVRDAILRLDPKSSCFSSLHTIFARVCLRHHESTLAMPILDNDIYFFPQSQNPPLDSTSSLPLTLHNDTGLYLSTTSGYSTKLNHRDVVEYFLYAAMLYMAAKRWRRASHFLEVVVTSPATKYVSSVMVEAYKKWILVSLLENDSDRQLSGVSAAALKTLRALAKPYDALREAFDQKNLVRLKVEIAEGHAIWETDLNSGLVTQVYEAFRQFSLVKLGESYSTIYISDLARLAATLTEDDSEVGSYLQSLIAAGSLDAEITLAENRDPSYAILRFTNKEPDRTEAQIRRDVGLQAERLAVTSKFLQTFGFKLELSREHVGHLSKLKANADVEVTSTANGLDVEEDMMSDL